VVIQKMIADGKELTGAKFQLQPETRRLEIEYASLSFAAADKAVFRYRLDGMDQGWLDAGQEREAFFMNLTPGKYRFRVAASVNDGKSWSEPATDTDFSILPHFYQTWWFRGICGALFAGLIWTGFALRRRQLESRFRAVLGERVRVAGEIHDSLAQGF